MSLFPNKNIYHGQLVKARRISIKTSGVRTSKYKSEGQLGRYYLVVIDPESEDEYFYNIENEAIRQALEGVSGEIELEGFYFGEGEDAVAGVIVRNNGKVVASTLGADEHEGEDSTSEVVNDAEEQAASPVPPHPLDVAMWSMDKADEAELADKAVVAETYFQSAYRLAETGSLTKGRDPFENK